MYAHTIFIDNRCNGCGLCAQNYPTIFGMVGGKAVVLGTANLQLPQEEGNASMAIEKCGKSVAKGGYGGIGAIWGRGEGEMPGHVH